jgi:hypothetical protein
MEENNSEIVQEAPETRGPSDAAARRKRRLIVGLVLGAALCAALAAAAAAVLGSPARVLAGAWKNTATVLEARSGAQPLGVAAEAIRNGKSGRRFTLSGGAGEQKGALTVTAGDGRLAARAELTAGGGTTDLSAYYGTEFAGIASRALFGGDTAYGAKPGSFAEEAKGGIFDPVSGEYPMNAETLRELEGDRRTALRRAARLPPERQGKEKLRHGA